MSNNTDTVRVYFPATIPKNQVEIFLSLLTGRDEDVLLDIENAVNRRIEHAAAYDADRVPFYDKVEFDAPVVAAYIDGDLLEDVADEVTRKHEADPLALAMMEEIR